MFLRVILAMNSFGIVIVIAKEEQNSNGIQSRPELKQILVLLSANHRKGNCFRIRILPGKSNVAVFNLAMTLSDL